MFGFFTKDVVFIWTLFFLFKRDTSLSLLIRSKNSPGIFIFHKTCFVHPPLHRDSIKKYPFITNNYNNFSNILNNILNTNIIIQSFALNSSDAENNSELDYTFPLYETKWQKFWDDRKLYQTSEPFKLKIIQEDTYKVSQDGPDLSSSHLDSKFGFSNTQNQGDSLTHFDDFRNKDEQIKYSLGSTCNFEFLNPFRANSEDNHDCSTPTLGPSTTKEYFSKQENNNFNNFENVNDKPKYYILSMIPYPSGKGLHVGHLLGYTVVDIIARYKRLNNFNVLNPIGFDCFGIPTELYSEKVNKTPEEVTNENVNNFRNQLKSMGFSFDFSRELLTSDVSYYKWTQWIFQQLFLHNLAYREKDYVNYCPDLGSELSNEEVENGKSMRGGFDVFKRLKSMWKLRITTYAKRLYDDLDLVEYPPRLVNLQRNWISPTQGYIVRFKVHDARTLQQPTYDNYRNLNEHEKYLYGFVDNLDKCGNIENVEFSVLTENILDYCSSDKKSEVRSLLDETLKMSNLELTNENNRRKIFSGLYVINPYNQQKLPLFISNCLVNMNQDINCKINLSNSSSHNTSDVDEKPKDNLTTDPDWYREYLNFNLKDWVFSRNRGWGEPIPVSLDLEDRIGESGVERTDKQFNQKANLSRVEREKLLEDIPVVLNEKVKETMPQWAGSCWHFLRFVDVDNKDKIFDKKLASYWLPVDLYVGGVEHSVSHLLYSRFWNKFLYDINVSPVNEPFKKIILHGVVKNIKFYISQYNFNNLNEEIKKKINETSTCLTNNSDLSEDIEVPSNMVMKYKGNYVLKDDKVVKLKIRMKKMSKSRGNVVSPEEIIDKYGSDALRLHLMFLGPVDKDKIWSIESISGVYKLLKSINNFCTNFILNDENWNGKDVKVLDEEDPNFDQSEDILAEVNKFIDTMTYNMENVKLNKVSEYFNFLKWMKNWNEQKRLTFKVLDIFLIILNPYAPHLTEHLWYLKHLKSNSKKGEGESSKYAIILESLKDLEIDESYKSISLEKWPKKLNVL